MDVTVRTEVIGGGTPQARRVLVKTTNEVGVVIDTRQTLGGQRIATVLFEDTGECRLYLDDQKWLEPA
ncbi:hypothetical protein RMN56_12790 [Micromonospora halotolerans]|uniref:Uncharacterized protein n=1 Tax=Micromonospora halotolerans TaxID=709879 RepID=A0ABZ0A4U5_9ACTN|nr:hypothetical protein [Micromonospora halotolerans]WNM42147.1 hypothetical protein RMN56_12790 [Micromonospora halotolerans]